MKKNILCFLTWVVITIVVWLIFINFQKEWEITNNQVLPENTERQVSFENKEQCMKYYDKYRDYLKEKRESYYGTYSFFELSDYEMFYNLNLDTCISAFGIDGMVDGDDYYNYFIVDYLNWEKELYHCYTNYSIWVWTDKDCRGEWEIEKEKYKN